MEIIILCYSSGDISLLWLCITHGSGGFEKKLNESDVTDLSVIQIYANNLSINKSVT